jgi:hypothetical protein
MEPARREAGGIFVHPGPLMNHTRIVIILLGLGAIWALFRLGGGESGMLVAQPRETPSGASFTMDRTFRCTSCGLTIPATTEEITRRVDAGQGVTDPKTFREFFTCDREGTPTLELIIDVKPKS